MKKIGLLMAVLMAGSVAVADGPRDGTKDLISAVTLCPSPNNPLVDGLKKLGGNVFGQAYANDGLAKGSVFISVRAIASPHSVNRAIMASDKEVGAITVLVSYKQSGFNNLLDCQLSAKPIN